MNAKPAAIVVFDVLIDLLYFILRSVEKMSEVIVKTSTSCLKLSRRIVSRGSLSSVE
jgi:hypothetical protein